MSCQPITFYCFSSTLERFQLKQLGLTETYKKHASDEERGSATSHNGADLVKLKVELMSWNITIIS